MPFCYPLGPVRRSTHTTRRRHHCGHNKSPKTMFRAFENDTMYHLHGQASCPDDTSDVLKDTFVLSTIVLLGCFLFRDNEAGADATGAAGGVVAHAATVVDTPEAGSVGHIG